MTYWLLLFLLFIGSSNTQSVMGDNISNQSLHSVKMLKYMYVYACITRLLQSNEYLPNHSVLRMKYCVLLSHKKEEISYNPNSKVGCCVRHE